jgi:hypothetical protein
LLRAIGDRPIVQADAVFGIRRRRGRTRRPDGPGRGGQGAACPGVRSAGGGAPLNECPAGVRPGTRPRQVSVVDQQLRCGCCVRFHQLRTRGRGALGSNGPISKRSWNAVFPPRRKYTATLHGHHCTRKLKLVFLRRGSLRARGRRRRRRPFIQAIRRGVVLRQNLTKCLME